MLSSQLKFEHFCFVHSNIIIFKYLRQIAQKSHVSVQAIFYLCPYLFPIILPQSEVKRVFYSGVRGDIKHKSGGLLGSPLFVMLSF